MLLLPSTKLIVADQVPAVVSCVKPVKVTPVVVDVRATVAPASIVPEIA